VNTDAAGASAAVCSAAGEGEAEGETDEEAEGVGEAEVVGEGEGSLDTAGAVTWAVTSGVTTTETGASAATSEPLLPKVEKR
jgi:hypothetical protein